MQTFSQERLGLGLDFILLCETSLWFFSVKPADLKQIDQMCVLQHLLLRGFAVCTFSVEQVEQAETATGLPNYVACRDFEIHREWTQHKLFIMTPVASSFPLIRDKTHTWTDRSKFHTLIYKDELMKWIKQRITVDSCGCRHDVFCLQNHFSP